MKQIFTAWNHESVRLTGRWDKRGGLSASTTNPGSYLEIAFQGERIVLFFDVHGNARPFPHVWLQLDGGPRYESALEPFITVDSGSHGIHILRVILKSTREKVNRWFAPLESRFSIIGYESETPVKLPQDNRKTIEFIGDSITEGILVDDDGRMRVRDTAFVYLNDACATYAWLTAEALDLKPRIMGFGAVGVTKAGNGGVPRADEAYPFVYNGCPLSEQQAEYIVINHGANDMRTSANTYQAGYRSLLECVRRINPSSRIFCVSVFYGYAPDALGEAVLQHNAQYRDNVIFIDSAGWVPKEPFHPNRAGHRAIAQRLTACLTKYLD